jgi:hypothetical protein
MGWPKAQVKRLGFEIAVAGVLLTSLASKAALRRQLLHF